MKRLGLALAFCSLLSLGGANAQIGLPFPGPGMPAAAGGGGGGCATPTAPNGTVDLSQCSNAYYVAVIF
jgi:hypothetical protein